MIKRLAEQTVEIRIGMRGGTGEVKIRHYFTPEEMTARTRLCAEMILPPGASIGAHEHVNEDEIYIVQRGQGKMTDGAKEIDIATGDAILTGGGSSHSIKNTGTEELVVTAVIVLY